MGGCVGTKQKGEMEKNLYFFFIGEAPCRMEKKNSQDVKYFVQLLGSDKHAVHDRIWKIEKIKERSDRMRKCGACNPMERSAGASLDSE